MFRGQLDSANLAKEQSLVSPLGLRTSNFMGSLEPKSNQRTVGYPHNSSSHDCTSGHIFSGSFVLFTSCSQLNKTLDAFPHQAVCITLSRTMKASWQRESFYLTFNLISLHYANKSTTFTLSLFIS